MKSTHSQTQGSAIEVRGLRKSYGDVEAVRGISFEVGRGEVFWLVGPNGAGKTTTARRGAARPDRGGQPAALFLSPGTVRNHLSSVMQKLNAHNRAEALKVAEEKGWL